MSNKIVTSVSALTDDTIDNISDNNIVCIDIEQGRIGVHKSNPTSEIDVSGTISCTTLKINGIPITPEGNVDFNNMVTDFSPVTTNTYNIGKSGSLWAKAYINEANISEAKINKLTVSSSTNRLYQEINGDISWNAVNGYYGLAKNAYPALDPISYGAKAVSNWTEIVVENKGDWTGICWSPELRIFVAVAFTNPADDTNKVMTSHDGRNWTLGSSIDNNSWTSVCWSPELKIFVAVGNGDNGIMTSTDGINWQAIGDSFRLLSVCWSPELGLFVAIGEGNVIRSPDGSNWSSIVVPVIEWSSVCWSPELRIFVAVAIDTTGFTNGVITSFDGITWTSEKQQILGCNSVCWSSELGIFVAVASNSNINTTIMTSSDGITWTIARTGGPSLTSVCWSPQLRIFVAVGLNIVMTSANGTSWIDRNTVSSNWQNICWSPELGIFVAVADTIPKVMISSLKGRPPTSYNVFDSSFNSINEEGMWTFSNVTISDSITIPSNSISTSNIANLNVTEEKIGPSAVTEVKIGPLAVTEGKIGALAVTNAKIGASAVTEGKIGPLAVTEGKIGALAVTNAKIADGTIIEEKLAPAVQTKLNTLAGGVPNNSIGSIHIINGSILGTDICDNTITSANIQDGTISGTDIASETIKGSNIAKGTITSYNIEDGTILGTDISDNTIVAEKLGTHLRERIETLENPSGLITIINVNNSTNWFIFDVAYEDAVGTFHTIYTSPARLLPTMLGYCYYTSNKVLYGVNPILRIRIIYNDVLTASCLQGATILSSVIAPDESIFLLKDVFLTHNNLILEVEHS